MSETSSDQDPVRLTDADARSLPTWRAAYSDRTAWLMSVFSQLAYMPFVDDQPPPGGANAKQLTVAGFAGLDPYLKPGGFEVRETFNIGNVQTFLAVNPQELAVLAFRGTANWADWEINLNAGRIPMPGHESVAIHRGFWNAFAVASDQIRQAVDTYVPADLGLYITGHSLGGALAQIASVVLERDNLAACYTFGSPRVATAAFDSCVKCPHYRAVNQWDLVPGLPLPTLWWGYRHTGDARLLIGARPQVVLRKDHNGIARFCVDLWSALRYATTRDFGAVDDHMIWNYRAKLRSIEDARAKPSEARPQV